MSPALGTLFVHQIISMIIRMQKKVRRCNCRERVSTVPYSYLIYSCTNQYACTKVVARSLVQLIVTVTFTIDKI